jgi:hypothetical protein
MQTVSGTGSVVPVANLESFFQRALSEAAQAQKVQADEAVIAYLTHLLTDYARSERLYDHTGDGLIRRPLVDLYRLATEADSPRERDLLLQRLGDVALFVSGILPNSLARSLVDVDYYISMGASAYGCLSDLPDAVARVRALRSVFAQLSRRFVDFVDVLAETVEQGSPARQPDLMRLHALWARTGSRRLGRKLVELGVTPPPAAGLH